MDNKWGTLHKKLKREADTEGRQALRMGFLFCEAFFFREYYERNNNVEVPAATFSEGNHSDSLYSLRNENCRTLRSTIVVFAPQGCWLDTATMVGIPHPPKTGSI